MVCSMRVSNMSNFTHVVLVLNYLCEPAVMNTAVIALKVYSSRSFQVQTFARYVFPHNIHARETQTQTQVFYFFYFYFVHLLNFASSKCF